jgi:membrane protein implicated in regulation of membrane protease activity
VVNEQPDPVLAKRARVAHAVKIALRVGYAAFLVAIVAFAIGLTWDFPNWSVAVSIIGLATAIVVLPLPIVLGYGVRAAEREERQGPTHHG